jgi:hypothetical protein
MSFQYLLLMVDFFNDSTAIGIDHVDVHIVTEGKILGLFYRQFILLPTAPVCGYVSNRRAHKDMASRCNRLEMVA